MNAITTNSQQAESRRNAKSLPGKPGAAPRPHSLPEHDRLIKLLEDATSFRCVVIDDTSRLGRNLPDSFAALGVNGTKRRNRRGQ